MFVSKRVTVTPMKINMEPKNHPIEEDNHLPNLHFWVPAVSSWGCMISIFCHGKDIGKDKGKTFKPCCHASTFIKLASIEKLT